MMSRKLVKHALWAVALGPAAFVACGGGGGAQPVTPPPSASAPASSNAPAASTAPAASGSADMPKTVAGTDLAKGVAALQGGDLTAAKGFLEAAVKKNAKDAEAHYYLGVVLDKSGDKAGAEKSYKDALAAKPDLDEAAANLAALYIDTKQFDDAIKLTKTALAKHPDDHALRTNLALAYAGKGDDKGARKAFDEALKIAPNDATLLFTYGHSLATWKDNEGALVKLRAARAATSDAGILAGIGNEMRTLGAFGDCIPTLDKAIGVKDAAEIRTYRGLCKLGAKDEAGAAADFQAAVGREATYGPAHFYLGNALARQAKWDDAVREYEAYLKLEPQGPLAKQASERLLRVKEKKGGGGAKK